MDSAKRKMIAQTARFTLARSYPLLLALVFLGAGYGIYMRSFGFECWWPICMAALIFAGSMEFITVGLLMGPFDPLYAFILTLIVNGRQIFYSISMLETYNRAGWKKFFLVSGLIDEAFSLNYITKTPEGVDRDWFMLFVTVFLYLSWVSGTTIGALSGSMEILQIKGIGFVMTALFVVIFISQWQKEKSHGASLIGLFVSMICLPMFGNSYFMLPAILITTGIFTARWMMFHNKKSLAS